MSRLRLKAENRTNFGKGASRQARRDGRIPGVIYGANLSNLHITFDAKELTLGLRKKGVVLEVETDKGVLVTVPREVQRDPLKQTIEHVDLVVVTEAEGKAHESAAIATAAREDAERAAASAAREDAAKEKAARDAAAAAAAPSA